MGLSQRIKESVPSKDLHHQKYETLFGLGFHSDHWLFRMAESVRNISVHAVDDGDGDEDGDDHDHGGHPSD